MWECSPRAIGPPAIPPRPPSVQTPIPPAPDADCALIADAGEPIVTVALSERIDPANAPYPSNESERLLFRQLYETLVRLDCQGRVQPGLAASWRLDASGAWIVTLRDNVRFSDGTPVTTAGVLSSWTRAGIGDGLLPQVSRDVQTVVPVDDRSLAITLRGQGGDAPLMLADVSLGIVRRVPGVPWPLGTRAASVATTQGTGDSKGRSIVTVSGIGGGPDVNGGANAWSLRFLVAPDRDGRDFLDEGVDLLATRHPSTLEYAATLSQFQAVPLEWHRTHVYVSAWRGRSVPPLPVEARQTLALDAVRGEARGAQDPSWWQQAPGCELPPPQPREPTATATGRIVYEQGDDVSRDLAERFVGLARAPTASSAAILGSLFQSPSARTFQRAVGLTREPLASALERGNESGYIVSLKRRPLDPCQELRALIGGARWLDPAAMVPLVDSRLRAITRRGRSGVTVEWDGGLLITPAHAEP
jgi:hypothetical protein